jgi:hypothetical protein
VIHNGLDSLSPEQFRDALRKGLGRAVQHVRNSLPEAVREDLLHACLISLACDQQIEGSRAPWLFFLLEQTDDLDYYGPRIYERYFDLVQDRIRNDTQHQLFVLMCEFAEYGCKNAKAEVYRFFDRQFEPENYDGWFYGQYAIVAMDGIHGLLYVLERFGRYIKNSQDASFAHSCLMESAEEQFGKEEVQTALKTEAERNEFVRFFLEHPTTQPDYVDHEVLKYEKETAEEKGKRSRLEYPLREMVERFLAEDFSKYQNDEKFVKSPVRFFSSLFSHARYNFLVAGVWADKKDLEYAYQKMCETDDPTRKAVLLKTFENQSLPKVETHLFDLLVSDDKELAEAVKDALSNTKHPLVREKALELLQANPVPPNWFDGLALLENNFQMEDIPTILSSLRANRITDDGVLYDIVRYLWKIDLNNKSNAYAPVFLWMYENSPCSDYREQVVECLLGMDQLPPEILEECRNDCNSEIRELAQSASQADVVVGN